jgi:hypothetical protein
MEVMTLPSKNLLLKTMKETKTNHMVVTPVKEEEEEKEEEDYYVDGIIPNLTTSATLTASLAPTWARMLISSESSILLSFVAHSLQFNLQ